MYRFALRDAPATRSRSVAKRERRRCSARFCRPRADRVVRMRCAQPAFHFKRLPARRCPASCAQSIEIERHASSPTVWTVCRHGGTMRRGMVGRPRRATPLRCAGGQSRRGVARPATVASHCMPTRRNTVSGCTHRRADATPAARLNRFSSTRRIRPRAVRHAPPRSASPRSPSVRVRRDGRPTSQAQLEETT